MRRPRALGALAPAVLALDEAPRRGRVVVGMKNDWRSVLAPAR